MPAFAPKEIHLTVPPGLEEALADEARSKGFDNPRTEPGSVVLDGGWTVGQRANLVLRGASKVLAVIDRFPVTHLAQLDKKARRLPWGAILHSDRPVRALASCRKSKIYHAGAAKQRVERAIAETIGAPVSDEAEVCIRLRLDHDMCTISVDMSGDLLHRRGFKAAVSKAPMRENLAALFLGACGYDGTEPVFDPMCGSGTFVIEAAEIAAGLAPGRARRFAFEELASFDPAAWAQMKAAQTPRACTLSFHGADRDAGTIRMSTENAERAGVAALTDFKVSSVDQAAPPEGPAGLVIVNPPYGARIGAKASLTKLYGVLGHSLRSRFSGWRVALVTSDSGLARATRLPFGPPGPPVDHGGIKIRLYQTGPLA